METAVDVTVVLVLETMLNAVEELKLLLAGSSDEVAEEANVDEDSVLKDGVLKAEELGVDAELD